MALLVSSVLWLQDIAADADWSGSPARKQSGLGKEATQKQAPSQGSKNQLSGTLATAAPTHGSLFQQKQTVLAHCALPLASSYLFERLCSAPLCGPLLGNNELTNTSLSQISNLAMLTVITIPITVLDCRSLINLNQFASYVIQVTRNGGMLQGATCSGSASLWPPGRR